MPGPSIVVRVLGDLKGFANSAAAAGKTAQSASSRINGAFASTLGLLNRTGVLGPFGEAIASVDEQLMGMAGRAKSVGQTMMGLGGVVAGAGVGFAALGSKDQAAHGQLQAAIEATGKSYEDYGDQVEKAIKHQEHFGDTANQTQDALRVLTQATGDPAKALQMLSTATDLAAAKHEGLSEAATQLGKVYNGNAKLLKEFGITVTKTGNTQKAVTTATGQAERADRALASAKRHLADIELLDAGKKKLTTAEAIRLRDAQQKVRDATAAAVEAHQKLTAAQQAAQGATKGHGQAVDELAAKLKGQGAAAADTFTGKMDAIKAKVEDAAASFGQKYGPAITAAGAVTTVVGGVIDATSGIVRKFGEAQKAAEAAQLAATAAAGAETTAMEAEAGAAAAADAASLPLIATIGLIVLAVAALVAIGYVIYRNWTTIWTAIKAATMAVFNWIKTNWPLLLAILTGPIGLAVLLIVRHWNTIWNALKSVFNWIKTNWPLLLAILTGPIGIAVLAIVKNWDKVKDGFTTVKNWIVARWNDLISFFTGIPGRIASLATHMFDGIANAFIEAINAIIRVWNGLQFKIPGFHAGPVHFGGFTLGVPDIPTIPHLAAGGLITSDGLIYAHAGEVVSPAPTGAGGPAMVINDAHFSSEVDVELLMRKAAWAVQTARV
jgi:hypothetical protein